MSESIAIQPIAPRLQRAGQSWTAIRRFGAPLRPNGFATFSSKTRSRPLLSTLPHRTAGRPEHRNEGDATGQARAAAHVRIHVDLPAIHSARSTSREVLQGSERIHGRRVRNLRFLELPLNAD